MGPGGAGLNGLLGSLTGGKFGAGAGGTQSTRLPTSSQLTVTLQPIYSRTAVTNFNLDDFAAGRMIGNGNKGGFI
jgi:hypothetical protein